MWGDQQTLAIRTARGGIVASVLGSVMLLAACGTRAVPVQGTGGHAQGTTAVAQPMTSSATAGTTQTTPTSATQETRPRPGSSSSGRTSGVTQPVAPTPATPPTVGSTQHYTPPSNVAPTHVQAQWSLGGPSAEWNGYPIAVGMGDPVNARVASPVTLELQVDQAAAGSTRVTLTQPVTFQVSICMGVPVHQANGTTGWTYGGRIVWRGILPPLHTVQGGAHLQFQWSGQDASGKQVPAGTYFAELLSPLPAVQYAITGGKSGTETLAYTPRTMTGQHYDEMITLTS